MAADMSTPEVAEVTANLPEIRKMEPFYFWVSPHSAIYPQLIENFTMAAGVCECARQALYDMEVTTARGHQMVRVS